MKSYLGMSDENANWEIATFEERMKVINSFNPTAKNLVDFKKQVGASNAEEMVTHLAKLVK